MHIPKQFEVTDINKVKQFIVENNFGLLISTSDGDIYETFTPFVFDTEETHLIGHIARANDQWKSWATNSKIKVVFQGAHAYISPSYYASEFNVPTWNYAAVSVSGSLEIVGNEEEILTCMDQIVAAHETGDDAWVLDRNDSRYTNLLSGIVMFKIKIQQTQAVSKMNQNKSTEDKSSVSKHLRATGCPFETAVAKEIDNAE